MRQGGSMDDKLLTIESLIFDSDFRRWVLQPDDSTKSHWQNFMAQHPYSVTIIEQAALLVKDIHPQYDELRGDSKARIWSLLSQRFDEANQAE